MRGDQWNTVGEVPANNGKELGFDSMCDGRPQEDCKQATCQFYVLMGSYKKLHYLYIFYT